MATTHDEIKALAYTLWESRLPNTDFSPETYWEYAEKFLNSHTDEEVIQTSVEIVDAIGLPNTVTSRIESFTILPLDGSIPAYSVEDAQIDHSVESLLKASNTEHFDELARSFISEESSKPEVKAEIVEPSFASYPSRDKARIFGKEYLLRDLDPETSKLIREHRERVESNLDETVDNQPESTETSDVKTNYLAFIPVGMLMLLAIVLWAFIVKEHSRKNTSQQIDSSQNIVIPNSVINVPDGPVIGHYCSGVGTVCCRVDTTLDISSAKGHHIEKFKSYMCDTDDVTIGSVQKK